ncbi:50S ribosomal protein L1 [Candidatus Nanosalina sp. VS9-1]|uniref:50S ribosomal protein L1 n=1 Tax=Candidatus Nanosalina sp. VS9-1 TaxID=3388566 RepID=UPI0039E04EDF
MDFEEAVERAIEEAEDRNFTESVDLIMNFRGLDLSDPNNRINDDLKLPNQADEDIKIAVIGDSLSGDSADRHISEDELEEMFDEPNKAKKLADDFTFLIAEAPLMPKIGQQLGQVFGPRNMMPDPTPPGSDLEDEIEDLRNTVSLSVKEQPLLQIKVGKEDHDPSDVARNANTVYNFVEENLPQGGNHIKNVMVKTTMGPSVEVDN